MFFPELIITQQVEYTNKTVNVSDAQMHLTQIWPHSWRHVRRKNKLNKKRWTMNKILRSKRITEFVSYLYFHAIPVIFVLSLFIWHVAGRVLGCTQTIWNQFHTNDKVGAHLLFEAAQSRSLSNYLGSLHPLCSLSPVSSPEGKGSLLQTFQTPAQKESQYLPPWFQFSVGSPDHDASGRLRMCTSKEPSGAWKS